MCGRPRSTPPVCVSCGVISTASVSTAALPSMTRMTASVWSRTFSRSWGWRRSRFRPARCSRSSPAPRTICSRRRNFWSSGNRSTIGVKSESVKYMRFITKSFVRPMRWTLMTCCGTPCACCRRHRTCGSTTNGSSAMSSLTNIRTPTRCNTSWPSC